MEQKKVTAVPERKSFVVEGSRGDSYSVKLFPYEKCQCPSTNTCYHIIAAKMSIGMDTKDAKGKVNLTQLRKNSRKRVDKKSGRKKPRLNDYDVIPAADSSFALNDSKITSTPIKDEHATAINISEEPTVSTPKRNKNTQKKDLLKSTLNREHTRAITFDTNNNYHTQPVELPCNSNQNHISTINPSLINIEDTGSEICGTNNNNNIIDIKPSFWQKYSDGTILTDEHLCILQCESHLTTKEKWLCSDIMQAAMTLMKNQYPSVNGLQSTLLAPARNGDKWTINLKLEPTLSPSVHIHHTRASHWVTSARVSDDGPIYLLVSC